MPKKKESSIHMLAEIGLSKFETTEKIINTYNLTAEDANDYVNRFYQ